MITLKKRRINRLRKNTLSRLTELKSSKKNLDGLMNSFSIIVHSFFCRRFKNHSSDNELIKIIKKRKLGPLQGKIVSFITTLSKVKYGKGQLNRTKIKSLINEFTGIVTKLCRTSTTIVRKQPIIDYYINKFLDRYDRLKFKKP